MVLWRLSATRGAGSGLARKGALALPEAADVAQAGRHRLDEKLPVGVEAGRAVATLAPTRHAAGLAPAAGGQHEEVRELAHEVARVGLRPAMGRRRADVRHCP